MGETPARPYVRGRKKSMVASLRRGVCIEELDKCIVLAVEANDSQVKSLTRLEKV